MTELFIGIDGGGTKTEVICAAADGTEMGHGTSGPTNLTSTTVGAASFNLKEAVRQSLEHIEGDYLVKHAVMGLAGLDTSREYESAYRTFFDILKPYKVEKFTLINDSAIALANGSDSPDAVILISGTGSICFGRNAAGETAKTGGMDYLLTDQGSGYDIGRHVLREAVKSYDGRREKTLLESLVAQHFGIRDLEELKTEVYNPTLSKIEVAELSQVCSAAFEQGDAAAAEIFGWAESELVLLVETVMKRLQITDKPVDLVFAGSILKLPHIYSGLEQIFADLYPQLQIVMPETAPVHGAVKMARLG